MEQPEVIVMGTLILPDLEEVAVQVRQEEMELMPPEIILLQKVVMGIPQILPGLLLLMVVVAEVQKMHREPVQE